MQSELVAGCGIVSLWYKVLHIRDVSVSTCVVGTWNGNFIMMLYAINVTLIDIYIGVFRITLVLAG